MNDYRFESGSLYIYDENHGCYLHCYRSTAANTKAKAIKAFEAEV